MGSRHSWVPLQVESWTQIRTNDFGERRMRVMGRAIQSFYFVA